MAFYTAINVTPGKGWNAVDEYYTGLRNDEWYQRISGSIFGGIYRRIGVPVGPYIDRRDVSQSSGAVLPSLDTGPANLATPPYGGSIAGPAALPNQTNIQTERPMDLAGILGGITQTASTIRDVRNILNPPIMGQQLQQAIPPGVGTTQVSLPSVLGGAVLGEAAESIYEYFAEPGLPAGVNGAAAACATKPSDIVYKWSEKDQRYVARKKYKRRRQRLATKSDIKDLASLKGIVGQGKVMETWIATHC